MESGCQAPNSCLYFFVSDALETMQTGSSRAVAEEEHPGAAECVVGLFLCFTWVQAAMEPTIQFNSFWVGCSAATLAANLSGKSEDIARSSPRKTLFTCILCPGEIHYCFFIAFASRAAD